MIVGYPCIAKNKANIMYQDWQTFCKRQIINILGVVDHMRYLSPIIISCCFPLFTTLSNVKAFLSLKS